MKTTGTRWPKTPPPLSAEQSAAREAFMGAWLDALPTRYGIVERFNHGALARLPPNRAHWRTLEIGAGIGAHVAFEDLRNQEYYCLELRPEFCEKLRALPGVAGVVAADIEHQTPFEAASFDRIIAIHTLEHLRDLPAALREVDRLLRPDGIFDVVLPCEGGFAYSIARRISAKPMFERRFKMPYGPIIANEHVNTLREVLAELEPRFYAETIKRFPFRIPWTALNLCVALRLRRKAPTVS